MPTALRLGLSINAISAASVGPQLLTPTDIFGSDLVFWFNSQGNTLISDEVDELVDKSGNGHNLAAADPSYRPAQDTGFISFDGNNDVLEKTGVDIVVSPAVAIFGLFKAGTYDATEDLSHNYFYTSNGTNYSLNRTSATAARVNLDAVIDSSYPISDDETFLFSCTAKSGTDNALIYKNAVLETTGTESSFPNMTEFRFGGRVNNLRIGQFDFYEFFLVMADPTVEQRQQAEGYICHNNGSASLLPVGHPYKGSAPTA